MTTKVKSIFKGLRYISQIFDEKNEEIEIGFPTDVKHIAHIGWDGPSATIPSWMNEFISPTEVKSGLLEPLDSLSPKVTKESPTRNDIPKPRRHHSSNLSSPLNSPTKRGGSDSPKHARCRRSNKDAATGSPARDSSGSAQHSRRHQKSNLGPQPEVANPDDQPAVPKKSSRRKKGVSSAEGGSLKSTRPPTTATSKGHKSLTEIQFAEIGTLTSETDEAKNNNEGVTEIK